MIGALDTFAWSLKMHSPSPSQIMPTTDALSLRFLGVGNSHARALGSSACVLERGDDPVLLIDCGPDTLRGYARCYPGLPKAIFVTHTHLDHVGGLESLFYKAMFDESLRGRIRLHVPVKIVEHIHRRLGDYPDALAEGGANFWDCFQLIPVSERFWHDGLEFRVFPARHHEYLSAFGIALSGRFLFTGDTRPIPEVIAHFGASGETILHDCGAKPNAAHTGVSELAEHYGPEQRNRMVLYHYESVQVATQLEQLGYRVARRFQRIILRPDVQASIDLEFAPATPTGSAGR